MYDGTWHIEQAKKESLDLIRRYERTIGLYNKLRNLAYLWSPEEFVDPENRSARVEFGRWLWIPNISLTFGPEDNKKSLADYLTLIRHELGSKWIRGEMETNERTGCINYQYERENYLFELTFNLINAGNCEIKNDFETIQVKTYDCSKVFA